jgi:ubiquinone/menaquinone biosynthesis C-methylase UbiE
MGDSKTGQVTDNAAKIYEEIYVPSLFEKWAPVVAAAADIQDWHTVLDVACGTGLLAITVKDRISPNGSVIGVDINDGMLQIAKSESSQIKWDKSPAESLPYKDSSFDRVLCQFSLMYFENQEKALLEMMRVLRPDGLLVFNVWDKLEENPGFLARTVFWEKVVGDKAWDEAPYCLGDKETLASLLKASGISNMKIETHTETAQYPSIREWMKVTAMGWTQDELFDNETYEQMVLEAQTVFSQFERSHGTVSFPTLAHIVTVSK